MRVHDKLERGPDGPVEIGVRPMLLDALNTGDAEAVGISLAEEVVLRTTSGAAGTRLQKSGAADAQRKRAQQFLQQFLGRVDREARSLKLNFFKRAKLANSFRWRLLDKGVDKALVEELTHALVLRLTAKPAQPELTPHGAPIAGARRSARDVQALQVRGRGLLARGAYTEAQACFEELLSFDSRNAAARNSLGIVYARM
ncbi:MAG: hypothetical protein ACLPTM_08245, partial [Steroidobacteraceae bacterium]